MKLLARQNRYYVGITLGLFVLGSAGLYGGARAVFRDEVAEDLLAATARLHPYVHGGGQLLPFDGRPQTPVLLRRPAPVGLRDTTLPDPDEAGEPTPYRQLTTRIATPAGPRWLVVRRSLLEADDLVGLTLAVMLPVMGAILGALLLANYWLARRLWAPLDDTLRALAAYDGRQALTLPATDVTEFAVLNHGLAAMSARVAHEVETLRAFTENAAHETQTPLAVLRARLDQLVQLPDLPASAHPLVADLSGGLSRLIRLYRALTLLSKIENGQFAAGVQEVDLGRLATARLESLADFIDGKHLIVEIEIGGCLACLHPALAESLVHNLLHNAVKHNVPGGRLWVRASPGELLIENTGSAPTADPTRFFERFRKHDPSSESPGLGLAICE
ncbi:MAG: HAMP domain-containing histidine kinase, partial [Hymenobacteraceae bacterium]|nr:HAMP domain-containing histidine kinase [Hymenobacteraceae bacterium]